MNQQLRIYLDQNKWIDLARAYHNHHDGSQFKPVLDKIMLGVTEERLIFPLSGTHVIETRKSIDLPRRLRLSQAMSSISRGWTIAPYDVMMNFELRLCVAKTFGRPLPAQPVAFGRGIPFACGKRMTLRKINGPELPMPSKLAQQINDYMSEARVIEDFMCGGDENINLVAVQRYEKGQAEFVKHQEAFRAQLRPYGPAIHKRAHMVEITLAIQPKLKPILSKFGKSMEDFLGLGKDKLTAFFSDVPTLNVQIELGFARNEDWNKEIDTNDSADIEFLSVAIPYCDIVVTENYWRHQVQKTKLDKKYGTVMLDDLLELEKYLD